MLCLSIRKDRDSLKIRQNLNQEDEKMNGFGLKASQSHSFRDVVGSLEYRSPYNQIFWPRCLINNTNCSLLSKMSNLTIKLSVARFRH